MNEADMTCKGPFQSELQMTCSRIKITSTPLIPKSARQAMAEQVVC